jgi:diketogulonate reductase-like aldo/keto reductase
MNESIQEVGLSNGIEIPQIGFGTYRMGGFECFDAVKQALDAGYRHIDTAMAYENESVVGRAIEVSDVNRDDVFVTTKIKGYPKFVEYDRLLEEAQGCLDRLGTDYIDLLLIHWWNRNADMKETFAAMDRLVDEGKVGSIGVSNFSIDQLERAISVSDAPILTNQIEYHPYWDNNSDIVRFCQENDITVTAYSPLAEGRIANDEVLSEIGSRYNKSSAQVAIKWLIQQENVITIPKTSTPTYIHENIDVFDFTLSDHEMERISDIEGPFRYRTNREGGEIHRMRGVIGPLVPSKVLEFLP